MDNALEALMLDLYNRGYLCGIDDERWFTAYANAAKRIIIENLKFSEELVDEEYHKLIDA